MEKICDYKNCTACNACINACPKKAIKMKYDEYNICYPFIEDDKCIECNLCHKVCPNNNKYLKFNIPYKVYAAWDNNIHNRNKSASGGIASCLQEYALKNNIITYGVFWKDEYKIEFKRITSIEELENTRNSKYLYSNTNTIFSEIKKSLEEQRKVLFIGVPCQVAGLKSFLNKNYDNLITIDIVCHGMPSEKYFENHIEYIKRKKKINKIKSIKFRINNNYNMILECDNKNVMLKETRDPYLVGYHKGVLYRECCYNCNYTKKERIGDITICDFWGLENDKELKEEMQNGISAVMINTEKGQDFFGNISPYITTIERTFDEVIKHNEKLKCPERKTKDREKFFELYKKYDFEIALEKALRKRIILGTTKRSIMNIIRKVVPSSWIYRIKLMLLNI